MSKGIRELEAAEFIEITVNVTSDTGNAPNNQEKKLSDLVQLKNFISNNGCPRSIRITTGSNIVISPETLGVSNLLRLNIHGHQVKDISIKNMNIGSLVVNEKPLEINDSTVCKVHIHRLRELKVFNSLVGEILFAALERENSVVQLDSCRIYRLSVPRTSSFGDFIIHKVEFKDTVNGLFSVNSALPDDLRVTQPNLVGVVALYNWAKNVGNAKVAHEMRGLELAIEAHRSSVLEKAYLLVWRIFSDYGRRPHWSLVWLFGITVLSFLLLYCTGSDVAHISGSGVGWRIKMVGDSQSAQIYRSVVGSLEPVFKPFSALSRAQLIVPTYPLVSLWQVFQTLLSLTLLFFFGFAMRRRFRLA